MSSKSSTSLLTPPTGWMRFRRHRAARIGGVVLVLLTVISVSSLPFSLTWYDVQSLDNAVRHPPALSPVIEFERMERPGSGDSLEPSWFTRLAHHVSSLFGHDHLGRSLFFRVQLGFLISAAIGLAAALMAVILGGLWGSLAGLIGGRVDWLMMRIVDVLYGLPYILMVILMRVALAPPLTSLFGQQSRYASMVILLLAIGSVSWLTMARVIRGQVLSLRTQPFVDAARICGAGTCFIIRRHILPNLVGPLTVYATLVIPQAILQEAFLSFLGIGIQQPVPSLGLLAADGVQAVNTFVGYWWMIAFPCGMLVITLLALNFLGDGLRDAFDPKSSASSLL